MRGYKIIITDPKTNTVQTPVSLKSLGLEDVTYTSIATNNLTLPNALNIEFDVFVGPASVPMGASWIRVWGISLEEISQANDINRFNIEVHAGMQPGLPLATAAFRDGQFGMIFKGTIYQAFGNWVGTDMTLDMILIPPVGGMGTEEEPKNLIHTWTKGDKLEDAIRDSLQRAFPDNKGITFKISPNLVFDQDETSKYETLGQYASYIKEKSKAIIGDENYRGVEILPIQDTFLVSDGTVPPDTTSPEEAPPETVQLPTSIKELKFQDIIGQPTWIEGPMIQVKLVLRSDIKLGDYIKFPDKGMLFTTTASGARSLLDLKTVFQGNFWVREVRHVANFRQADPSSWVTILNAFPTTFVLGKNG